MPQIELAEETLTRARRAAEASHLPLERWIADVVERTTDPIPPALDPLLGLFSDAPDVMDALVADAMRARQTHSLRHGAEQEA